MSNQAFSENCPNCLVGNHSLGYESGKQCPCCGKMPQGSCKRLGVQQDSLDVQPPADAVGNMQYCEYCGKTGWANVPNETWVGICCSDDLNLTCMSCFQSEIYCTFWSPKSKENYG